MAQIKGYYLDTRSYDYVENANGSTSIKRAFPKPPNKKERRKLREQKKKDTEDWIGQAQGEQHGSEAPVE